MSIRKLISAVLLVYLLMICACKYIVLPEGLEAQAASGAGSAGWSAVATNIGESASGDLHIDLTIRNETGDWSAMNASAGKPAVLTSGGKDVNCETVYVSTGGHRLTPGFQMRGYTAGSKAEPVTQLIFVECAGTGAAPGATLTIPYTYETGQYNYYEQGKNTVEDNLEIDLDSVSTDLEYPVFEQVDGLIQESGSEIIAINKVALNLTDVERTDSGLKFIWKTYNPGEYPSYVHIGTPPVIGDDGILYGYYETPDIVSVPITPATGEAEWSTEVIVPQAVSGLYIPLSVETGKARLFANYAVDITDQ